MIDPFRTAVPLCFLLRVEVSFLELLTVGGVFECFSGVAAGAGPGDLTASEACSAGWLAGGFDDLLGDFAIAFLWEH